METRGFYRSVASPAARSDPRATSVEPQHPMPFELPPEFASLIQLHTNAIVDLVNSRAGNGGEERVATDSFRESRSRSHSTSSFSSINSNASLGDLSQGELADRAAESRLAVVFPLAPVPPGSENTELNVIDLDLTFDSIRELGAGAFGVVDLVRLLRPISVSARGSSLFLPSRRQQLLESGHLVALKSLPKSRLTHPRLLSSVLHESFLQQHLKHPHIARLFFVLESFDSLFFGFEYCEGGSLLDWIQRENRLLSANEARRVGKQVLQAVEYLHSRGVVHGDLKLSNLLVCGDKKTKTKVERGRRKSTGSIDTTSSRAESVRSISRSQTASNIVDHHVDSQLRGASPARILPPTTLTLYGLTLQIPQSTIQPRSSSLPQSPNSPVVIAPRSLGSRAGTVPALDPYRGRSPVLSITRDDRDDDDDNDDARSVTSISTTSSVSSSSPESAQLRIKITDFGFSYTLPFSASSDPHAHIGSPEIEAPHPIENHVLEPSETHHPGSQALGTPRYLAPELWKPSRYPCDDPRAADIWAIGVILFAGLFGRYPFDGETEEMIEALACEGDLVCPGPEELDSLGIPEVAVDLVHRMLDKNPEFRISAKEALAHPVFQSKPGHLRTLLGPLVRSFSGLFSGEHKIDREACRLREFGKRVARHGREAWERRGSVSSDRGAGE